MELKLRNVLKACWALIEPYPYQKVIFFFLVLIMCTVNKGSV